MSMARLHWHVSVTLMLCAAKADAQGALAADPSEGTRLPSVATQDPEVPLWARAPHEWRELPRSERWQMREAFARKRNAKALAQVPDGWSGLESKSKYFVAISHVDKKATNAVLDQAGAIWNWLDARFADVSDEYVMGSSIRLCADPTEAMAFGWKIEPLTEISSAKPELVLFKGNDYTLQSGLIACYFGDKDPNLAACPPWFVFALSVHLVACEVDGKGFTFKVSPWAKDHLREARRADALRSLRQLITQSTEQWPRDPNADLQLRMQMASLIAFLDSKECERLKGMQRFLPRYASAVIKAAEQWQKEHAAPAPESHAGETPISPSDATKARVNALRERERFVLDAVTKEVADLLPKDWLAVEAAWKKWLAR